MNLFFRGTRGRGNERIEVADLENPDHVEIGERASSSAVEGSAAAQCNGQLGRPAEGEDKRLPFAEIGRGRGKLQAGCGRKLARGANLRGRSGRGKLGNFEFLRARTVNGTGAGSDRQLLRRRATGGSDIESDLGVRITWRSPPAGFHSSAGSAPKLHLVKHAHGSRECVCQSGNRHVSHPKSHDSPLLCRLLSAIARGLSQIQPIDEIGIARDGSAQQASLQLRQLDLLVIAR